VGTVDAVEYLQRPDLYERMPNAAEEVSRAIAAPVQAGIRGLSTMLQPQEVQDSPLGPWLANTAASVIPDTPSGQLATVGGLAGGIGKGASFLRSLVGAGGGGGAGGLMEGGQDSALWRGSMGAVQGMAGEIAGQGLVRGVIKGGHLATARSERHLVERQLGEFVMDLWGKAKPLIYGAPPVDQVKAIAAQRAAYRGHGGAGGLREFFTGAGAQREASAMYRNGMTEVSGLLQDTLIPVPTTIGIQRTLMELSPLMGIAVPSVPKAQVAVPDTVLRYGKAQPALTAPPAPTPLYQLLNSGGAPIRPVPGPPAPPSLTHLPADEALRILHTGEDALANGQVPVLERASLRTRIDVAYEEIQGLLKAGVGRASPNDPTALILEKAHNVFRDTQRRYAQQKGVMELAEGGWKGDKFDANMGKEAFTGPQGPSLERRFYADPKREGADLVDIAANKAKYNRLKDLFNAGRDTGGGGGLFQEGSFGLGESLSPGGSQRFFPRVTLPRSPRGLTGIPPGLLGPPAQGFAEDLRSRR
jgi:hypothetical protein